MKYALFLFLAAGCEQPEPAPVLKFGPTPECTVCQETYDGHDYYFSEGTKTYADAQAECAGYGMNLVTVNNAAENDWLYDMALEYAPNAWWWIGLDDLGTEGEFKWVSGAEATFMNWADGEPNDNGGAEDCTLFALSDDTWNDGSCDAESYYICE